VSVVVLDQQRVVTVVDNGPSTQVTVSSLGLQGPQGLPTTVNGHTGASITLNAADVGALDLATRGAVNGVAQLDSGGLVPIGELPLTGLAGNFMDLATNQTAAGIKTFSGATILSVSATTPQVYGSSSSGGTLTLNSTSNATKGKILLGTSAYDEVNNRLGVGLNAPSTPIHTRQATGTTATLRLDVTGDTVGRFTSDANGKLLWGPGGSTAGDANFYRSGVGVLTTDTSMTIGGSLTLGTALAIAQGGTGQTAKAAAYDALSPNTTLGDVEYRGASNNVRLAGSTSATKQFLTQTGNGTISAAPAWGVIQVADVPTLNQNTTGTAANVTGTVAIANGGTGSTTQNFVDLTTTQATIAGSKTFTGAHVVTSGATITVQAQSSVTGGQIYRAIAADTTTIAFEAEVTGDSVHRLTLDATGKLAWGTGSATRDTNLYRSGVGTLTTDTAFVAGTTINGTTDVQAAGVSLGRGIVVAPTSTVSSGTPTSSSTEIMDSVLGTLQATLVSGRRYRVEVTGLLGGSTVANDLVQVKIRDSGSSSTPTTASALVALSVWECQTTGGPGQTTIQLFDTFVAGSSGTHTFAMFSQRIAGSGIFTPLTGTQPRKLAIYDVGNV